VIKTRLTDAYDESTQQRFIQKSPLHRLGEPEDVACVVLYLSAASGAFVTGSSLVVDGGMTVTVF
jgi:NAD(P)-dependent dehydrogenase (short-subunit alcohol dehydrogenase family)